MQEYKVKRTSVAVSIGIFSALLAAVAGMLVALSQLGAMEIKPSGYWVVRWLTPLVCSFLIPGIVNIIRSFRSYKVDAQTISRKGLLRETTLRWDEIDDYEQSSVSLRLKDASGQEIWLSRFEPRFAEISDEFDQRLAPIKRRMFTRWRNEGATLLFDFRQFLGASLLFTPALMILFDYATLPFIGNMREVAGLILAFSLMLPGILAFALPCFYPLYIRLLPDSIESFQVWTGKRRFQFKSIASIINGGITSGADISTVLKDANGKRIYLPTSALQSNLVTEYLRERIDKEIVAQGRQEFASERTILYRKRLVSVFGGTLLLFVMFTGGVYIQSARRMQELGMIKQHGVRQFAVVTNLENSAKRSKYVKYIAHYHFVSNERGFDGQSRISFADFNRFSIGSKIPILFLSNNPNLNMADASISQKTVPDELRAILLGPLAMIFFVMSIAVFQSYRKIGSANKTFVEVVGRTALNEESLSKMMKSVTEVAEFNKNIKFGTYALCGGLVAVSALIAIPDLNALIRGTSLVNSGTAPASALVFTTAFMTLVMSPQIRFSLMSFRLKKFLDSNSTNPVDSRLLPQLLKAVSNKEYDFLRYNSNADRNVKRLLLMISPAILGLNYDQIRDIEEKSRDLLISLLSRASSQEELQPFTLAILKAIPLFGNRQALEIVRKLSNDSNLIPVLEEARRVLPLLEARVNDLRQGEKQELLSPSSAPIDEGLLIPHEGRGETASAELLRPESSQVEAEITKNEDFKLREYAQEKELRVVSIVNRRNED